MNTNTFRSLKIFLSSTFVQFVIHTDWSGQGDDCDFCINFGASMNEVKYNVSFMHVNNGTETLMSTTGWIQKSGGQYCIPMRYSDRRQCILLYNL